MFDFDDTLVKTNILFDQAKSEFNRLMTAWGLGHNDLMDILNQYDIKNVLKCSGFAKECFPNALLQTYLHYCAYFNRDEVPAEMDRLVSLGWDVLYEKPEVLEDAAFLLDKLNRTYRLFLLTKGDRDLQEYKIRESGLEKYFHKIYIPLEKNIRFFQDVIDEEGISIRESWSVGNSIKADINPALIVGLRCIHLQTPSWDFENAKPQGEYYSVKNLREVENIIRESQWDCADESIWAKRGMGE